jgi:hypothetical protein
MNAIHQAVSRHEEIWTSDFSRDFFATAHNTYLGRAGVNNTDLAEEQGPQSF